MWAQTQSATQVQCSIVQVLAETVNDFWSRSKWIDLFNFSTDLNTHLHASETNGSHVPAPQQPMPQPALAAHGPGRPTVIGYTSQHLPNISQTIY